MTASTVLAALVAGCGQGDAKVDVGALNVGTYSTALRTVKDEPSPAEGTVLEGIRMSEAVADTSQFGSPLVYLWQADPVPDTASLVPVLGEGGAAVLDQHGWVAGFRASYADRPRQDDGTAPAEYVGLAILLLRFPDDGAAQAAAAALEVSNWKDFDQTVPVPLPKHPEVNARYTPGTGALATDIPTGPFVIHLMIDAPADGIETRVADLDAALDAERVLLDTFHPTPVAEIPALPRDPDGLLARMVTTDPANRPPVSGAFAVYGPTGALRAQAPGMRQDELFERWGVDRLAISGDQQLFRLRDNQAALEMLGEFNADFSGVGWEIEADPQIPGERCIKLNNPGPGAPGYACQVVVNDLYTTVRGNTATTVKQRAAAQYALLAGGA
jgi:hypothetical protein